MFYGYTYDGLGQLTAAQFGTIEVGATPTLTTQSDYKLENISYDKNGNLATLTRKGQAPGDGLPMDQLTYNYTLASGYKENNRLNRVTDAVTTTTYAGIGLPTGQQTNNYTYNALGQLTGDVKDGRYFDYHANGRARSVYANSAHTQALAGFTYDAAGNRLCKTSYASNGTTVTERTWYLRDASGALLSTVSEDAITHATTEELTIAGVGSYLRSSNTVRYALTDHLGNTRVTFTADENGSIAVEEAHDYYPHGGLLPGRQLNSSNGSPLAYQGQEFDEEVGLTAFNLRQYDARLGRWISPDPYGQHYSPYLAMSNNPVTIIDPDGGYDGCFIDGLFVSRYAMQQMMGRLELTGETFDLEIFMTDDNDRISYAQEYKNVMMIGGIIKSATEKQYAEFIGVRNAQTYSTSSGESTLFSIGLFKDPYTGRQFAEGPGQVLVSRSFGTFADRIRIMHHMAERSQLAHMGADIGGLLPGLGEPLDALNAIGYAIEGDYANARLSAAAMIPFAGWFATGGKLLKRGSDAVNAASAAPSKYTVGVYDDIRGKVPGMDAHHVGQKAALRGFIPNYNPALAPAILVPDVGHTISGPNGIVSRNLNGFATARDVLARDIRELRRVYTDIPNSNLQELIQLNKDLYPIMNK